MRFALWRVLSVLAALVAAVALLILNAPVIADKQARWSQQPIKVAVALTEQKSLPQLLSAIGALEAARQVTVQSEVDGRIAQILFRPGETVRAGQSLVQLNDEPEQGELVRQTAQLTDARLKLERMQRLVPQRITSQEQLDMAQTAYDQAIGDLRKTRALIEQKLIRAPFSGVLGIRQINLGQFAHAGNPIVTLTDKRMMLVNFSLPERVFGALKNNQAIEVIVDAYPGRGFAGQITSIEPQIDASTRTIRIQATLDNSDSALVPGMFANVSVMLPARLDALTVPETAVTYSAYGNSVYVIRALKAENLTVQQVYVRAGERRNGLVVIEEGLKSGERVVVSGQVRLSNGAAVTIIDQDTLGT